MKMITEAEHAAFMTAIQERDRLHALINNPQTDEFLASVRAEAAHQRDRWGEAHDRGKSAENWFWLVGYLAGKCLRCVITGDKHKALHHTISSAAALANWYEAIKHDETGRATTREPNARMFDAPRWHETALYTRPAPQPQQADYSQISPEQASAILAAVDLRVRKAAADFLLDRSNASGRVVQAEVREILEAAAAQAPQAQAVSQWISVDERLPAINTEVLVAFDGLSIASTGQYTGHPKDKGGWCYPSENNGTGDNFSDPVVTHWMPLPEAPASASQKEPT